MPGIILLAVCLICAVLKKAYEQMSVSADVDDTRSLHIVFKHLDFVSFTLGFVLIAVFAMFSIEAATELDKVAAFLVIFTGFIFFFVILPSTKNSAVATFIARAASPLLAYLLRKAEEPVDKIERLIRKIESRVRPPRRISKKALKELLEEQEKLAGEETGADIRLSLAGLGLNTRKVKALMVPLAKLNSVSADEKVGPVLLSELHETGRRLFPIEDASGNVVGIVSLDDLAELKAGGKASDALKPQMVIINEHESLRASIYRFIESSAGLIFIENDNGELLGAIYIEDVLKQLTG
ncbi:MAG TPA: CBS domain-containing protein [Candidatus Saccharimonadales bacterium]|nr:CBS domain-containing protein [Candidatus Saccharimonadales bacterium]